MAYKLVNRLKDLSMEDVLKQLAAGVNHPCIGKWHLSPHPEAYLHSSASFYNLNKSGLMRCVTI
jgi:hypothetical protein